MKTKRGPSVSAEQRIRLIAMLRDKKYEEITKDPFWISLSDYQRQAIRKQVG